MQKMLAKVARCPLVRGMTIIGYARVSTDGQSLNSQIATLKTAGAARIYRETASGAKSERRELARALKADCYAFFALSLPSLTAFIVHWRISQYFQRCRQLRRNDTTIIWAPATAS